MTAMESMTSDMPTANAPEPASNGVGVPVTDASFRATLGRFASGVGVMTTALDQWHGMTVNAIASVSLNPPLVLVCVQRGTVMEQQVTSSGVFALSFLAEGQDHVSTHFANSARPRGSAQFADIPTKVARTGSPVIADSVAWVDCRVWQIHDGGDHVIVLGEVVALDPGHDDVSPLLYHSGSYGHFQPPQAG